MCFPPRSFSIVKSDSVICRDDFCLLCVLGRDSDGNGEFFIDRITGVIRTKVSLDHEEKSMYRLSVAATDNGHPPKQTIRMLRVEVLDLNDNRPTFTSSSLVFQVSIQFFFLIVLFSTLSYIHTYTRIYRIHACTL